MLHFWRCVSGICPCPIGPLQLQFNISLAVLLVEYTVMLLPQLSFSPPLSVSSPSLSLLTLRIWHMSLPDWSLAAAIQYISCCPSSWIYSHAIASAFILATTLCVFPVTVLYSTLSFSSPVIFHIFNLSFFYLTALSVSSFHHQLSNPAFFFPVDLPHSSSPHVLICSAISSHDCPTFSVVASSVVDSLSTRCLRNFSFVSSYFTFHHIISFLPAALRCLVFFTTRSAISSLCCVVIASEGSTLQFLHSFACFFLNMIYSRFGFPVHHCCMLLGGSFSFGMMY